MRVCKKEKKRQNQFCWGFVLIVSMQAEYFTSINIDSKDTYIHIAHVFLSQVDPNQMQMLSFRSNVSLSALILSDLASTGRERRMT